MISWWNAAISGNSAWAREARRAMVAAGERQLTFSPESLISFDVRDLQALTLRLRQRRRFVSKFGTGSGASLSGRLP
jgi:hypothetical protein